MTDVDTIVTNTLGMQTTALRGEILVLSSPRKPDNHSGPDDPYYYAPVGGIYVPRINHLDGWGQVISMPGM